MHYLFCNAHYNRIEAGTYSIHLAGITLLTNLGFKIEGVLRERVFVNDRYVDTVLFGITKTTIPSWGCWLWKKHWRRKERHTWIFPGGHCWTRSVCAIPGWVLPRWKPLTRLILQMASCWHWLCHVHLSSEWGHPLGSKVTFHRDPPGLQPKHQESS